ncbi:hypothetical protein [Cysteiniphilum sp. 6C5]|uniref:hypothetical protein n=1 Tax=unclassified Cysteiniphilum TaxID=2610889 RepID=UPI003F85EECE
MSFTRNRCLRKISILLGTFTITMSISYANSLTFPISIDNTTDQNVYIEISFKIDKPLDYDSDPNTIKNRIEDPKLNDTSSIPYIPSPSGETMEYTTKCEFDDYKKGECLTGFELQARSSFTGYWVGSGAVSLYMYRDGEKITTSELETTGRGGKLSQPDYNYDRMGKSPITWISNMPRGTQYIHAYKIGNIIQQKYGILRLVIVNSVTIPF